MRNNMPFIKTLRRYYYDYYYDEGMWRFEGIEDEGMKVYYNIKFSYGNGILLI